MRITEFERELKKNGFFLKRRNKHPIWTDGKSTIVLPSGGPNIERRLSKSLKIELKKALALREPIRKEEDMQQFNPIQFSKPVPVQPQEPQKPTPRACSPEEAWKVYEPMRNAGVTTRQAAERLFDMGILKPNGKIYSSPELSVLAKKMGAPLLSGGRPKKYVLGNKRRIRTAPTREAKPAEVNESKRDLPSMLTEIKAVIDSAMSDSLKKMVIQVLAEKM